MIRMLRLSVLSIFLTTSVMAYEAGQLSLDVPNVLKKGEGRII